ncbi:MAG TPA: hypothetical protein VND62_05200 [Acidimicrobiales bacterium]|nr:hypothetical protein [Acidimicrobiales bacterium]
MSEPPRGDGDDAPHDRKPAESTRQSDKVVAQSFARIDQLAPILNLSEEYVRRLNDQLSDIRDHIGRQVSFRLPSGLFAGIEDAARSFVTVHRLAGLSRMTLGDSMLTGELAAQSALRQVLGLDRLIGAFNLQATAEANLNAVLAVGRLAENHTAILSRLAPSVAIARSIVWATRAWDDVLRAPPQSQSYLPRIEVAGRTTGWAVEAGIALTETDPQEVVRVQAEASAALGPGNASAELRVRLHGIHPSLSKKLDGAWERINNGGTDAASQAANSLMEAVDWTLRQLAPDGDVLAWHTESRRPGSELSEGRPTRTLRIRFAVRDRPEKREAIELYLRSAEGLVKALQGIKHGLEPRARSALVPVAMTVEGLLDFILLD